MTLTCKQIAALATERAEGTLDAASRAAFDEHVRGCGACATYVRQLEVTRQAFGRLPEPERSPALDRALMAGFDAWVAARASPATAAAPRSRRAPWSAAGALSAVILLVALARHRSQAPRDWMIGAALAVAALAVASLGGRLAMWSVVGAVAAAVIAAVAGGGAGPLEAATGAECLALELFSAALVAGAAWLGARGGARASLRIALATGGLAGALGADAALQLTCPAHGAMLHLLAFHLGGVLLAAAAAVALVGRAWAPGRTPAG